MDSLSICLPNAPAFALVQAAPPPPLAGWRWLEQKISPDGAEMTSCALVTLRGAGIREWLEGLEAVLTAARHTPFTRLERRAAPGDEPLTADLYEGWLEADPLQQSTARGGFSLRLYLRHSAVWRKAAAALPLSNASGQRLEGGITFYNHHDGESGHQNFADLSAADLSGAQPAPLGLHLRLSEPPGSSFQRVILAAGSGLQWGGEAFPHVLEGEAALPGSDATFTAVLTDTAASGGAYRRVEWTRPDSAALLRWTLSAYLLGFCAGRLFRPVVRLPGPPPEGVYLRWSLLEGGGHLLEESPPLPLEAGHVLQATAGLNLPPRWLPAINPAALTLELRAESRDSSTKRLDVDFIHLLPAEGWLQLDAVNGAAGDDLWVDGDYRAAFTLHSGGQTAFTHTFSGAPPRLLPGLDYRLYLLWETESGSPVNSRCEVQAFYAPRVKLP